MSLESLSPGLQLSGDNPWPGLQAFEEAAQRFFFGREEETDALFRLVRREALTVFYGQSGLGKTSLIQAGLFPRLRKSNLLPVAIRLDYTPQAPSPLSQVKTAIAGTLQEKRLDARAPTENESLWEYFHRNNVDFWDAQNRLVTLVLVFDQFEERFTLGRQDLGTDAKAEAFLTDLCHLVGNRPPPAVQARFETDPATVGSYDFEKRPCKVILSLREDFLPEFEGLRDRFPDILENSLRLEGMTKDQAREVVLKPGGDLVSEPLAERIVDLVSASKSGRLTSTVDPALLSVFCYELNQSRIQRGQDTITADLLGERGEGIIESFYEVAFDGVKQEVRDWVEDNLLTGNGYRQLGALGDAVNEHEGRVGADFARLVDRRILHRVEHGDVIYLELTHDLLTAPAVHSREARQQRRAAEEAARREQEVRRQLQETEMREREALRQLRRSRIAIAVVSMLVFFLSVSAFAVILLIRERHRAKQQEITARQSQYIANVSAAMRASEDGNFGRARELL